MRAFGPHVAGDHSKFPILQRDFTSGPEVTSACLTCHTEADDQMMHSIHFKWEFDTSDVGHEPRCTSCHAGYGWEDMSQDPPTQLTEGTGRDANLLRPIPPTLP